MNITQWLLFFIAVQIIHFLGTWKLYKKAGRKPWEAIIPVYNAIVLMQIINRPKWWVILLFIPIINLIMFPVIWVETIRSFGKNSRLDTLLVVATLGFYIFYLNYALDVAYISDRSLKPKSALGEWVSSILFAVVAATLVHTYFIQPYVIPTSSLEKTLLVGDFLFVSKFHYGARAPMTTVAMPMVHDTIPVVKTKSYLKWPQLPYFRLPGFQKIKRNDIVVFNWPVDTVQQFFKTPDKKIVKPIDKKSNYVKRCVGIPGDTLEIKNGYVFINGKQNNLPDRAKLQFSYKATLKGSGLTRQLLANRYDITDPVGLIHRDTVLFTAVTEEAAERLKHNPNVAWLGKNIEPKGVRNPNIFPQHPNFNWNQDNFGPIYIPKAGETIQLNLQNLPLYKRVIKEYEGNTLEVKNNQIYINNTPTQSYTFKQDYYWMMGDNRHNSEDARVWGFVPFNHVVGKPVFIWMSWDSNASGIMNKIRWERLFTTVGGNGKPVSYFKYFLIILFGWLIFDFIRKRKKASK